MSYAAVDRNILDEWGMMFQAYLLSNPWDFSDVGIDAVLDFVQCAVCATGLTLTAGSGPRVRLRYRKGKSPDIVRTRGGLFFAPDQGKYAATRYKPVTADSPKVRGWVAKVAESCRARGLRLRLAVSTLRLGRLAAKHPPAAVKNVLDDVSPTRLCPSNPDVVEMVAGLVDDLSANYSPDAIVLHDFDRGQRGEATAGMEQPSDLGAVGDALLSLCACESCRRAAAQNGVDVDAAVRSARVTLERMVEAGAAGDRTFADLLSGDDVLREYVAWQLQAVADALASVRRRCAAQLMLHRRGDEIDATANLAGLSRHVDGVVVSHPEPQDRFLSRSLAAGGKLLPAIESIRSRCAESTAIEIAFDVSPAAGFSPQSLVADLATATDAGVTTVSIADLGLFIPPVTDAVKQAIRYARRSTGA